MPTSPLSPQGPGFGVVIKPQPMPNFGDPAAAAAKTGPVAAAPPMASPATATQPAARPADVAVQSPAAAAASPDSPAAPPSRKSGRFLKPTERLPKGLPDWFAAKDTDGDGQVTMAEFASEWTPEKIAEFARYDLNHDGIITAAECLKADKQPRQGGTP